MAGGATSRGSRSHQVRVLMLGGRQSGLSGWDSMYIYTRTHDALASWASWKDVVRTHMYIRTVII
eukprot:1356961-Amorphochlora_amoeboformis.AAC.1